MERQQIDEQREAIILNTASDLSAVFGQFGNDYLLSLQPRVEQLRRELYRYAMNYNFPLGPVLINHYKERLKSAEGRPMIGEYAPYIFGDLFSVKQDNLEPLIFPWLLLYEYSLLLDDLLDNSRYQWPQELLLSQILLESSLSLYREALGDVQPLWAAYTSYRRESIDAMINEIDWLDTRERGSDAQVIILQGRKAALVKFCAATIVYMDQRRLLTAGEEEAIDFLCSGIQLLDDTTDVSDDRKTGRMNLLLKDTYTWYEREGLDPDMNTLNMTRNQLTVGLICSGSLSRMWKITAMQIDRGLELLKAGDRQSAKYFHSISSQCLRSSKLLDEVRRELPRLPNKIDIDFVKLRTRLDEAIRYVEDGPKASN